MARFIMNKWTIEDIDLMITKLRLGETATIGDDVCIGGIEIATFDNSSSISGKYMYTAEYTWADGTLTVFYDSRYEMPEVHYNDTDTDSEWIIHRLTQLRQYKIDNPGT